MLSSRVTYIAFKIAFMHSLEIEPMILDAGFYSKIHTYFLSLHSHYAIWFFFQKNHAKITAFFLMCCHVWASLHVSQRAVLTNLMFLFCPEHSNHSARITSLWHICIHLVIPALHRGPVYPILLFWGPIALQDLTLLGCSSSQLVLNTFYHTFSALNN